jgi:signal transduction histidine kinase
MTTTVASPADYVPDASAAQHVFWERLGRAALLGLVAAVAAHYFVALPILGLRWAPSVSGEAFAQTFVVPYATGLIFVLLGLLIFRLRRTQAAGRALSAFCLTAGLALGGSFDLQAARSLTWSLALAAPLAGASLLTLGLVFPQELMLVHRRPGLRLLPFVPALAVAIYGLVVLYRQPSTPAGATMAWAAMYGFLVVSLTLFLAMLIYRRMAASSPVAREQSHIILLGALGALALPLAAAAMLGDGLLRAVLLWLPLALFPAGAAWALLRYRRLDSDGLTAAALVYAGVLAFTLVAYGVVLTGFSLMLGAAVQAGHPAVLATLVFILVAAFNPLRQRLQALVNEAFFRGTRPAAEQLESFGRDLTRAVALKDVVRALDQQLAAVLRPSQAWLFLLDTDANEYAAFAPEAASGANLVCFAASDLRFARDGALARSLARERSAIVLTPHTPLPAELMPDRAALAVLGAPVFAPLHGQAGLAGWLAAGPRLSGQPLTRGDLYFLEALADQSALAVERATVISDLERRVRELNVLSQMAQAANFTLVFDDLLELIFAQTSRVVDTRNFSILLREGRGDSYRYAFYVENDERDHEQEQGVGPPGRGLAGEVLRTRQPLRTDDYAAECRRRGVAPGARPYRTWMGVPLNAGADTIGVMSVASFEAAAGFTADEQKIFSAVADQAASAIVRAQLYQKTDERARQLATLNELSTTLASSLELDPLLERIVQTSMEILGCEAGSLFLTDEETGEYVFRVAAGPVGHDLVGMRLPPGKGFVGEAIETGAVLIVNDVQSDPRWFQGSDQSTGFVTRALMVVPLRRGQRTVGALEVINKRSGAGFDEEDSGLLTAFAGQATVAIENARLFTQTDQALAERVAELSMMQRIDRELNAALDVQRVMDIALEWAMKNTQATAGSMGMVTDGGIVIIATSGYGDTVEQLRDRPFPIERGIMGRVVRTGQMSLVRDVRSDPDYRGVLPDTRCQLTIPIAREGAVVGLINLESSNPNAFTSEQVAFVDRLLEHASVAITNARLYSEVTAANIAKSDFVSIAAHELKTPMTSIKMAAELMLSGAVGTFNETQRQFMTTIRNNLDRMTTIVSDLNDITRIETGRLRLEVQPIDFQSVIDEVLRATRALVEAKQQDLRIEAEPRLPLVLADPNRAAQVLTNLVTNAHKYTPDQGQIVVRVEVRPAGGPGSAACLHVAVRDNGIGISPEDQQMLFTKFFRSEDRAAREMAPGTGLGLSIVKNLVELQGGRIWAESELRRGSTFHFTLPLAVVPAPEAHG